jgi:folate-dependent phosphoribosylglycinamide formyltransferase PurN
MKKIIILTGDECRHTYFRKKLAVDTRFVTLASFCEGLEKSMGKKINDNKDALEIEKLHMLARDASENDFFSEAINFYPDKSNPIKIKKGEINNQNIVQRIISLKPDLIICYGSSLINSDLLEIYKDRFLNVHLGLSPYYRGSATNVWPLINDEPFMIGATFMFIDAGIDTGRIIHQIRPDIYLGDSPHSIGNRLIRKMTDVYSEIIINFDKLTDEIQPQEKGRLYKIKEFDGSACEKLYAALQSDMLIKLIKNSDGINKPYIVRNKGLE